MMSTILSILEQTEGLGKAELNEMKKYLLKLKKGDKSGAYKD